jgi:hypothetical protein
MSTTSLLLAGAVSFAIVLMYVWQDGVHACPDGQRYTSGRAQPYPFHRRFCGWNQRVLIAVTFLSLVALGALMGTWSKALLLITLPGAWLIATRPTTVDAPAMLLAFVASLLFPSYPWAAVLLSCLAGCIHERGPVFAALYAWHPLLLIGLVCIGWWRTPAPADDDPRVGVSLVRSLAVHHADNDWLGWEQTVYAMRGLPLMAAHFGTSPAAWVTLALAWSTRLICSDLGRLVFWAGPIMIRDMPEVPTWMVLAQVFTFRRMHGILVLLGASSVLGLSFYA